LIVCLPIKKGVGSLARKSELGTEGKRGRYGYERGRAPQKGRGFSSARRRGKVQWESETANQQKASSFKIS